MQDKDKDKETFFFLMQHTSVNLLSIVFAPVACWIVLIEAGLLGLDASTLEYFGGEFASSAMGFAASALLLADFLQEGISEQGRMMRAAGIFLLVVVTLAAAGTAVMEHLQPEFSVPFKPPVLVSNIILCFACCLYLAIKDTCSMLKAGSTDGAV